MSRRPTDPRAAAEAAFKSARPAAPPAPRTTVVPGARQLVSLRIDADVLELFQEDGPGWQDRINDTLREAMSGRLATALGGGSIPVSELSSEDS
jgi:uncharacterized protein (DUF4415 family)